MSPVVHPEGCRCPGCLPGQYVMRQNRPPSPRPGQYRASARRNPPPSGGGWGIIVPFFAAALLFIWPYAFWHGCKDGGGSGLSGCGSSSEWVWNSQTWIAQGIWWALLIPGTAAIAYAARLGKHPRPPRQVRTPRPPKGRLKVEATVPPTKPPAGPPPRPKRLPSSLPVWPQPPVCQHVHAVRVGSSVNPAVTLENWCPDCEENLGAGYVWSCCGAPPGNRPGAGHLYNCPHRERRDITGQWPS